MDFKYLIVLIAFCVSYLGATDAFAASKYKEAHFCGIVAKELNGTTEVKTKYNKRVDIVTDGLAMECDWTTKIYQAIGQALVYAELESKRPGIVFFHETHKTWSKNNQGLIEQMSDTYGITIYFYEVDRTTGEIWHNYTYN